MELKQEQNQNQRPDNDVLKTVELYDQKIINISGKIYFLKDRLFRIKKEEKMNEEAKASAIKDIEVLIESLTKEMRSLQVKKNEQFKEEIEKRFQEIEVKAPTPPTKKIDGEER